ncbi:MAG TPA: hypothetical protein VFI65_12215, partial [Streptosporangiaceae bacterium]|nr:hypothetical protein [Streptosporangiaceae bacterium]
MFARSLRGITAVVAAASLIGMPAGPAVAKARPAASQRIAPPQRSGALRIAGLARDGNVVRAAGLVWRPGRIPKGDRLLSFGVAFSWKNCAGPCQSGSDSTATPFAASTYIVGHGDTGRKLQLTETATEVVETRSVPFSFSVINASATVKTRRVVRAYPSGRAPRTEFVDGLPEHRTGSREEYFSVDPPHYQASLGKPVEFYRIDHGSWHKIQPAHAFYTGKLALGAHQVSVRTVDRGGASILRFRWRVTALPKPVPCHCWLPPHLNSKGKPMRWDWQIGRATPLERTGKQAVDLYDIDGFLTTKAQVH